MPLPSNFNPADMTFGNVIRQPRNTSTSSSSYSSDSWSGGYYRRSLWSRFNDGVIDLGNWIADKVEAVSSGVVIAIGIFAIIAFVIGIIITWVNEGFWSAFFAAAIICVVASLLYQLVFVLLYYGFHAIMYVLRIIFWNGWVLLAVIGLAIGIGTYAAVSSSSSSSYTPAVQTEVTDTYGRFRCVANTLNVRTSPDKNSPVVGTLRKGQEVEVLDIVNGFACIEYKGNKRYASVKYLVKI